MNQWYIRGHKRNHVFHTYTSFFHAPFTLKAENEAAGSNIHRHGSEYHKTHRLQHRHNLANHVGWGEQALPCELGIQMPMFCV